ncbi:MAG: VCBS repeat-containing protein, partial [Mariniphaga sp.]|nr:VCBS repeat-containing protein [Mariniphaga sp.]
MDLSFLNRAHRSIILLLLAVIHLSCRQNTPLLEQVKSSHSGIHFNNLIVENDSINQLDNGNVFNGGGVGIGDFNNDGLPDLFFSSNLGSCKLYLNKGNFKFQDI